MSKYTVYDHGSPREPTEEELRLPTNPRFKFRGCPVFIAFRGYKEWCQRGRENHGGTHG